MKQQYVFFDEFVFMPARGNGKVLTTIRLLLKQLSKEPKPISPYKYREAIHKDVKFELDAWNIEFNKVKQLALDGDITPEQFDEWVVSVLQNSIRREIERMKTLR